jgi:hypothetical protein
MVEHLQDRKLRVLHSSLGCRLEWVEVVVAVVDGTPNNVNSKVVLQ